VGARPRPHHGLARIPAWELTLAGTAVRLVQGAVDRSGAVVGPALAANQMADLLAIRSALVVPGGDRLVVGFVGTAKPITESCGADYTARAFESATAVVVVLTGRYRAGDICPYNGIWGYREATVFLDRPLADRSVLDAPGGRPVPVAIL
jgi:hypothetical protein